MFGMFGKLRAQPGKRAELEAALLEAAGLLADAPGARSYVVYRDEEDPDAVGVFEVWDSREDHRNSLQLDAVRDLIAKARPILAGAPESKEIEPLGGLGLHAG